MSIYHIINKIKEFPQDIKHAYQRARKGYSFRDLWSIDDWFMEMMPNMLTDYKEKLQRMNAEQDSLYEQTYYAYLSSDFKKVFDNYEYMDANYPASPLMPKFALLNAFSKAKTDTPETFKTSLEDLIVQYPNSDVTSLAKDMLAFIAQGYESKTGESHGSLLAARERETLADPKNEGIHFNIDRDETHFFVIYIPKNTLDINKLQYNIAVYNFSKFMIKDFDIEWRKYDEGDYLLVRNLEGLDEALWYQSGILQNNEIANTINANNLTYFVVSKDNFGLIFTAFSLEEYMAYFNENIANSKAQKASGKTSVSSAVKPVEAAPATTNSDNAALSAKPVENAPLVETPNTVGATLTVAPLAVAPETAPEVAPIEEGRPQGSPQQPQQPKFRGLYAFDETAKHYFALYIMNGDINFEKIKTDIGKYNAENYPLLNMQITEAMSGKQKIVLIGTLPDAASAKSYLLRIVKDKSLFEGVQGATYRNLVITQENLDTLNRIGNPGVYLDFLREYYLK